MTAAWGYIRHVFIALDQLCTTIIGGWPDETLSSYAWRMDQQRKPWGFLRRVIDTLFWWQRTPGHCERSYIAERKRSQHPPELRA